MRNFFKLGFESLKTFGKAVVLALTFVGFVVLIGGMIR